MATVTFKGVCLATTGFLTLQSGEVPIIADALGGGDPTDTYPTVRGGFTYGYTDSGAAKPLGRDRTATNVRFPGTALEQNVVGSVHFKLLLPVGATTCTVRLALGDYNAARNIYCKLSDSGGALVTVAAGVSTGADDAYVDATGAVFGPTTPSDGSGRANWIAGNTAWVGTVHDYLVVELGDPATLALDYTALAYLQVSYTSAGGSGIIDNDNLQGGLQALSGGLQG